MEASVRPEISKPPDNLGHAPPRARGWRSGAFPLWPVVYRRTLVFSQGDRLKFIHIRVGAYHNAFQNRKIAPEDAWKTSARRPQRNSYGGSL
eukprot:8548497-Karenia_brevis.AAC.1